MSGYSTPKGDGVAPLVAQLEELARRLSELEVPTGTSMNSLVAQVQEAIANIDTTVEAWLLANAYTAAEIDALIANPPAGSAVTGNVSATGSVSASGAVTGASLTTSGNTDVGGQFRCLDAYNTDITWTRKAMWVGNDGRFGYASSSRDKKMSILPAEIDVDAFLSLSPSSFFYRAEIERRTQLRIDGIDLDYRPARELGLMAQDVAAAGLGAIVYLNDDGDPDGIEYSMLTVPLLAAARKQASDHAVLVAEVAELRQAVAALQGKGTPG